MTNHPQSSAESAMEMQGSPPKQNAVKRARGGNTFGKVASRLHRNGFVVMPVKGKAALLKGFSNLWKKRPSDKTIGRWINEHGDLNTGLCLGEVIAVDIDIDDQQLADEVHGLVIECLGESTFLRFGRRPRRSLIYRVDPIVAEHLVSSWVVGSVTTGKVELLGPGRQLVIYGTHPDTAKPYEWPTSSPLHAHIGKVPWTTDDALCDLKKRLEERLSQAVAPIRAQGVTHSTRDKFSLDYLPEVGERDNYLFWYAREKAMDYTDPDNFERDVLDKNAQFTEPLADKQARNKAKSVWKMKVEGRLMRSGKNAHVVMPFSRQFLASRNCRLSPPAAKLLVTLAATRDNRHPFAIPQQATANYLGLGKPTIVGAIKSLIANGLIERCDVVQRHAQRYRPAILYKFAAPSS